MQLDPKTAMIIKIVLALLTAISTGTLSLTGIVSPQTATLIVAVAATLVTILGIVMSAYSSSTPGPLAPPDSLSVIAATKVANLTADDSLSKVNTTKQAAIDAVTSRNPKAGSA